MHIGVDNARFHVLKPGTADTAGRPAYRLECMYLSGRRGYGISGEASSFFSIYTLLQEIRIAWRSLVRVRQFVTDPGADFN